MVARKFSVRHGGSAFDVDYDTDDGFEVLKFQLFSLTSIPPDQQKILRDDENHTVVVSANADLESVSDRLRLVSIDEDERETEKEKPVIDDFVTIR